MGRWRGDWRMVVVRCRRGCRRVMVVWLWWRGRRCVYDWRMRMMVRMMHASTEKNQGHCQRKCME